MLFEQRRRDEPIIKSFLDTDFYKFTMGNVVFNRFFALPVKYGLTNRTTAVRLADHIDQAELRENLDHVRTLRPTRSEYYYLRGMNAYGDHMFRDPYLDFVSKIKLPEYDLSVRDGQFDLNFYGQWSESIYWETMALPIINELYYRSILRKMSSSAIDALYAEGIRRLEEKIKVLESRPDINFTDFGTRRRFSRQWHEYVVTVLEERLGSEKTGQFLGTSNTFLAFKLGLLPMGTSAHEMYMVLAALLSQTDEGLLESHNLVLQIWEETYGEALSVALTDTFGSEFFFRDMTERQARFWKGLRQDSGDPGAFGERAIRFYEDRRLSLEEITRKLIVFSDGLELLKMIALADQFRGRIKVTFGWGTNLTNDLGLAALSLVIKVIYVWVDGKLVGTVKLSDNWAKSLGAQGDQDRYKRVFGYGDAKTMYEACKY
jgi:nicotinate phosphoribosyltransferase